MTFKEQEIETSPVEIINTPITKVKKSRSHDWTRDEQILAYYFYKYADSNGFINTYWREFPGGKEGNKDFFGRKIAESIGTTYGSLKMMADNFGYLEGNPKCKLDRPHKDQTSVFEEWKGRSRYDMEKKMKEIIGNEEKIRKILIQKAKGKFDINEFKRK
jgi:hypothetical protein